MPPIMAPPTPPTTSPTGPATIAPPIAPAVAPAATPLVWALAASGSISAPKRAPAVKILLYMVFPKGGRNIPLDIRHRFTTRSIPEGSKKAGLLALISRQATMLRQWNRVCGSHNAGGDEKPEGRCA